MCAHYQIPLLVFLLFTTPSTSWADSSSSLPGNCMLWRNPWSVRKRFKTFQVEKFWEREWKDLQHYLEESRESLKLKASANNFQKMTYKWGLTLNLKEAPKLARVLANERTIGFLWVRPLASWSHTKFVHNSRKTAGCASNLDQEAKARRHACEPIFDKPAMYKRNGIKL